MAALGMGYNGNGELGDGTFNNTNRPEQIVASNVTAIAAAMVHSLFLKSDGSLWAMGDNGEGELGDGTTDNGNYATNRPEQIIASNVVAIAAGYDHSLFLKSNGSLWAMGYNCYGKLGDGTANMNTNRPEQIVTSNVTTIAAGSYFSLFLKSDGSLWGMGYNGDGELGDGTLNNTNRPEQILAAYNQICCRLSGGTEYAIVLCGHRRRELCAGPFIQPVTSQLGSAGNRPRCRSWGACVHQHARSNHQQFLAHFLCAVAAPRQEPHYSILKK